MSCANPPRPAAPGQNQGPVENLRGGERDPALLRKILENNVILYKFDADVPHPVEAGDVEEEGCHALDDGCHRKRPCIVGAEA